MQTTMLHNASLRICFGPIPAVAHDHDIETGATFEGASFGAPAIMLREGMEARACATSWVAVLDGDSLTYTAQCTVSGKAAASFCLTFTLHGRGVQIRFHSVEEAENFYLFRVCLPRLIVVSGDGAKLAIPADKGRLIDVNLARAAHTRLISTA